MEIEKQPAALEKENAPDGEDFTAIFDRESVYNQELWRALVGPQAALPKKGDLVVYFPQGHLEYAALFPPLRPFPSTEAPTFGLQPQIICRVHVQLIANKKNDEVCAHVTLLSEPEEAVALDFHGAEWIFELNFQDMQGKYWIARGWSAYVRDKHLLPGDTVVFMRGEDREQRLGIRRAGCCEIGVPESIIAKHYLSSNFLSPVADAILNKSMFHVFYSPMASVADFLIPYEKYMKSITSTRVIGTNFQMQYKMDDSLQRSVNSISYNDKSVVNKMDDLDPNKWPNSKWRCLIVSWDKNICRNHEERVRVSPWEIVSTVVPSSSIIDSPPKLKRQRTSQQDNLPVTQVLVSIFQLGYHLSHKMVNCMNLKSLGEESVDSKNRDSVGFGPTILVICDCPELEFLPEGLRNLNHLELLLSSLVSFPQGGLPNNSLIALLIYECESLKFLPSQLHKATSLRFLNISDCPSFMSFPQGGLVSLCIIDCENLVHPSQELRSYTFIGGCPDRRE
ncbi:hypothetical protein ACOSQ2_019200 [Xanthoceras sorbifolium]